MKVTGKIIVILLSLVVMDTMAAHAGPEELPRPAGFVSDHAGVIDATVKAKLERLLGAVERKSTAEVAVVTVPSLDNETIESYAVKLFEQWGIGKKDKDNGVLLLVAPRERKMRIEVGYGLEGALPDGLAGEIRDRFILPYFKLGDYGSGIWHGTVAIIGVIGREYDMDLLSTAGVQESEYRVVRRSPLARLLGNLLYLILLIFVFGSRFWFFPLFFGLPFSRGYWSGGGYYGGGGGFSGGFGGFGGGLSGGGGASGSW